MHPADGWPTLPALRGPGRKAPPLWPPVPSRLIVFSPAASALSVSGHQTSFVEGVRHAGPCGRCRGPGSERTACCPRGRASQWGETGDERVIRQTAKEPWKKADLGGCVCAQHLPRCPPPRLQFLTSGTVSYSSSLPAPPHPPAISTAPDKSK